MEREISAIITFVFLIVGIGFYGFFTPTKNVTRSMVYILPSENCTDYWKNTYGDRIYYYVYGNLSHDKKNDREGF